MSTTPTTLFPSRHPPSEPEARGPLRAKTLGTRLSSEELAEVETAAKAAGKNVAEWLREVALRAARPSPDVNELLLSEIAATRYLVLNLFEATARAEQMNEKLPPETVTRIRDAADSRKRATAQKLLEEFRTAAGRSGAAR